MRVECKPKLNMENDFLFVNHSEILQKHRLQYKTEFEFYLHKLLK